MASEMGQLRCFGALILALSLCLSFVLGSMDCEDLPVDVCAYAISSSGARCVLEKNVMRDGFVEYECQTSIILEENLGDWIETDECMKACGLERMTVGLSTDVLVERDLVNTLCSRECESSCPNIFDLYTKLAAGEGVYLPHLCEAHRSRSRKLIDEVTFASKSVNTIEAWELWAPTSEPPFGTIESAAAPAPAVEV